MVKQTSHVHNRSHEGASHCILGIGITAPIEELIIEQKHEKKFGTEHPTVSAISALMT